MRNSGLRRISTLIGALLMLLTTDALMVHAAPRATQFTLANGMEVVVVPDNRAPVVTHMVW